MRTVKIGIYDEEQDYVEKLSAYLNRKGKGKWAVAAYTSEEILEREAAKNGLDVLFGTNRQVICKMQNLHQALPVLWLTEEKAEGRKLSTGIMPVYRYQGAAAIAETLEEVVKAVMTEEKHKISMVAVYSPVGRCGKTGLALQLVKQGQYGNWLYIGMEDYSFLWRMEKEGMDSFLYYIKERNEEQLGLLLEKSEGIIPSAFSPFDTKCMEEEDFKWLLTWLQKTERYFGVVFDFSTGALSKLAVLDLFDYVVVPFLQQEKAIEKTEQFNELISAYGMDGLGGQILYVNMESEAEKRKLLERISGGGWDI